MRTSLIETERIENWLFEAGSTEERLLMEAQALTNAELRERITWQSKTYHLIEEYGREKLRAEIRAVEQELFQSSKFSSFRIKVLSIFNRKK